MKLLLTFLCCCTLFQACTAKPQEVKNETILEHSRDILQSIKELKEYDISITKRELKAAQSETQVSLSKEQAAELMSYLSQAKENEAMRPIRVQYIRIYYIQIVNSRTKEKIELSLNNFGFKDASNPHWEPRFILEKSDWKKLNDLVTGLF